MQPVESPIAGVGKHSRRAPLGKIFWTFLLKRAHFGVFIFLNDSGPLKRRGARARGNLSFPTPPPSLQAWICAWRAKSGIGNLTCFVVPLIFFLSFLVWERVASESPLDREWISGDVAGGLLMLVASQVVDVEGKLLAWSSVVLCIMTVLVTLLGSSDYTSNLLTIFRTPTLAT